MVDPSLFVAIAQALIEFGLREAVLAQQRGELTPEQLADIKARAKVTDDEWDRCVAALPPVA